MKEIVNSDPKHQSLPWEVPGWNTEVEAWIAETLGAKGIMAMSSIQEVQRRPWSVLLRVSTAEGNYYVKVCSPVLQHEPGLTKALAGWTPDHILPLIAIDPLHGWMLMPDGGPTLRSRFEAGADRSLWVRILPVYARMQIKMEEHTQELLRLGIIDRRLSTLPDQFETLLVDTSALRVGKKDGLTLSEFEKINNEVPVFRELCGRLAEFGIPETLQHDDFHDGNIFYSEDRPVFFDWGECCLAHPFFSMVVGLNSIAYRFNLKPGDAHWSNLRDAYLAPWEARFDQQSLLAAFDLAIQIGAVNRALTWHRVVSSLPPRWKRQNADAVPGWLQEYLQRRSASNGMFTR